MHDARGLLEPRPGVDERLDRRTVAEQEEFNARMPGE
jgi:hypothetical protein